MSQDLSSRWIEGDFDGDFEGRPSDAGDPFGSSRTVGHIFRGRLKNARPSGPPDVLFPEGEVRQSIIPEVYASFREGEGDGSLYEIALADVTIRPLSIRSSRDGDPTQQLLLGRIQGRLRGRLVRVPTKKKDRLNEDEKLDNNKRTRPQVASPESRLTPRADNSNEVFNSEHTVPMDEYSDDHLSKLTPSDVPERCRFCRFSMIATLSVCISAFCWIFRDSRSAFETFLLFAAPISIACIIGTYRTTDSLLTQMAFRTELPRRRFDPQPLMNSLPSVGDIAGNVKPENQTEKSASPETLSTTYQPLVELAGKSQEKSYLNQPSFESRSVSTAKALLNAEGSVSTDRIIFTVQNLMTYLKRTNGHVYRELLSKIGIGDYLSKEQVTLVAIGTSDDDLREIMSRTELIQKLLSKLRGVDPYLHMQICRRISSEQSLSGLPG